jgi:hypothetical protein
MAESRTRGAAKYHFFVTKRYLAGYTVISFKYWHLRTLFAKKLHKNKYKSQPWQSNVEATNQWTRKVTAAVMATESYVKNC